MVDDVADHRHGLSVVVWQRDRDVTSLGDAVTFCHACGKHTLEEVGGEGKDMG